jgi:transcription-repair coupling factor (superfamily II helicase)
VTQVREFNEELVRDAILRELERDGQVYYVHNRVETIDQVAQRVQRLVPDARIRIGHGQMSEDELERIMLDFYHRNYDILVCTTIIENGLDVPNVNTIVVDRADRLGLAQLYQLRGRVGRSDRQAYAYLLYPASRKLSSEAEQRLMAIREFTELGSGFQIAMRDLEIRGAGNLLGGEQSGAMAAVGFDLYCQLLAQAVAELRGEDLVEDVLPTVDLPVTACIPDDYIASEAERIYFYKRMSSVRSVQDIAPLVEELEDRFGDPPRPVWTALEVLRLRLRAKHAGIAGIRSERRQVVLKFAPGARLTAEAVRLLTLAYKQHRFQPDCAVLTLATPDVLTEVEAMVGVLEQAFAQGRNIVRDEATRRQAEVDA